MTREEAKQIVMFISGSYPNFKPLDLSETVDAWATVFSKFDVEQVKELVKAYIMSDTKGFPPTISNIIQIYQNTVIPQELNEMEAWSLVRQAIQRSGYYSAEEFKNLPPLVRKAVGLPNQLRIWALDENYNESVTMSHFIKCYREVLSQDREKAKMPSEIRNAIEKTNRTSYLAQIEQKRKGVMDSSYKITKIENREEYVSTEGIPMPDKYKSIVESMRNENRID